MPGTAGGYRGSVVIRLCWTLLFLTAGIPGGSSVSDPLTDSDRISSYVLHNRQQCVRLCWYVSTCVRYSYRHDHAQSYPTAALGGAGADGDNCVLHASVGGGLQVPEGWREEQASGQSLPPIHGCVLRHCGDREVCIPVVSREGRSVCAALPGYNDCASSPCVNGGTCVDQGNNYTCNCAAGYTGRNCQTDIADCASSPCVNGGTCVDQVNNYTCNCDAAYTGRNCQTDIDDCASSPCVNGGTCVDQVNNYTCNCAAGYTGRNCQTDIDDCASSPCVNGGTCVDQVNNYTCNCDAGYTGRNCQTDIDDCASSPCVNGGTCVDQVNNFTCSCAAGYTGPNCQTDIDDCDTSPCVNGGTCVDQLNNYTCNCDAGFTGWNCQRGFLGSNCTSRTDCLTGTGNICLKGLCLCDAGYVFSVTGNTCILASECSSSDWLSSYTLYPDSGVMGHNDMTTSGTVDECLAHCSANECRNVERKDNGASCYHSLTPIDDSMFIMNDPGWDTYIRNCA